MADSETVGINLQHEITSGGKKFLPGQNVKVPREMAEDLTRIDYDHSQYEKNLIRSRTYDSQIQAGR